MSAQPIDDHDLERQIDSAYKRMVNAVMADDSLIAFHEMVELIRQRSPARIKQMERERRLRR
jgi:hypothetical protein